MQYLPANERPKVGSVLDDATSPLYHGLVGSVMAAGATFAPPAREITSFLPEPFDFMQHATNAGGSFVAAYLIGQITARTLARFNRSPRLVRVAAAVVAIGALTVANALVETHTGYSLLYAIPHMADIIGPLGSTPDPVDFAWGVLGATAGAVAAAREVRAPDSAEAGQAVAAAPTVEPVVSPDAYLPEQLTLARHVSE